VLRPRSEGRIAKDKKSGIRSVATEEMGDSQGGQTKKKQSISKGGKKPGGRKEGKLRMGRKPVPQGKLWPGE